MVVIEVAFHQQQAETGTVAGPGRTRTSTRVPPTMHTARLSAV
ncbi:hypothetical protein ABTX81_33040 [Kitasatospora sp. NPDC097605]